MAKTLRSPRRLRQASNLAQRAAIGVALDELHRECDYRKRLLSDPVEFVHRYESLEDQELVGLMASALAFGSAVAFRGRIEDVLARLAPSISGIAECPTELSCRLRGFQYRFCRDKDVELLMLGARRVQMEYGSLGRSLAHDLAQVEDLRMAVSRWVKRIREAGGLDRHALRSSSRGATHILADPEKGSAVKRIMLFLRWMVRPADGVDLGLWTTFSPLTPALLVIPLDTHIHKLAQNLGFTRSKSASWKAAEEITVALRRYDPNDPVKYDFALCHLGMAQRCPSRRDDVRCEGCGIKNVCRHWWR